jgi:hypothetical protein
VIGRRLRVAAGHRWGGSPAKVGRQRVEGEAPANRGAEWRRVEDAGRGSDRIVADHARSIPARPFQKANAP